VTTGTVRASASIDVRARRALILAIICESRENWRELHHVPAGRRGGGSLRRRASDLKRARAGRREVGGSRVKGRNWSEESAQMTSRVAAVRREWCERRRVKDGHVSRRNKTPASTFARCRSRHTRPHAHAIAGCTAASASIGHEP